MTLLSGGSGHGGKVCKQRTVKRCDSVRRGKEEREKDGGRGELLPCQVYSSGCLEYTSP